MASFEKGGSFLLIAGGLGLVPLRPAVLALAARRDLYKSITLLYGARTQEDLLFTKEMEQWKEQGIDVKISLDRADPKWRGDVGFITALISKNLADPPNTRVLLCGPEIMMKNSLVEAHALQST